MNPVDKQKQRKQARLALDGLIQRQQGYCYWCHRAIIRPSTLDEAIYHGNYRVVWVRQSGVEYYYRVATVDHLIPLKTGGSNHPDNLVAACYDCNNSRHRERSPKSMTDRCTCPKCGQPKSPKRRKCIECRTRIMPQHYVYLLTCRDGTLYTGYTTDINKRVATHNAGKGAKYTRSRLPVTLTASWEFPSKSIALQAEYRIKQLPRSQKLVLVNYSSDQLLQSLNLAPPDESLSPTV